MPSDLIMFPNELGNFDEFSEKIIFIPRELTVLIEKELLPPSILSDHEIKQLDVAFQSSVGLQYSSETKSLFVKLKRSLEQWLNDCDSAPSLEQEKHYGPFITVFNHGLLMQTDETKQLGMDLECETKEVFIYFYVVQLFNFLNEYL